jgi:hypothetical protein
MKGVLNLKGGFFAKIVFYESHWKIQGTNTKMMGIISYDESSFVPSYKKLKQILKIFCDILL